MGGGGGMHQIVLIEFETCIFFSNLETCQKNQLELQALPFEQYSFQQYMN